MLNIQKLIASARACIGWPYVSPGTNDQNGIDCSGVLVKAYRDQGSNIYHGSNTIYRKHCSVTGRLVSETQLQPGMVVFKHKDQDTAKYPDGLGDFCHIGLVTQTNPLEIVHASSDARCVTTDSKIGKWKYWGKLKDVIYPDGTTMYDPAQIEKDDDTQDESQKAELGDTVYDMDPQIAYVISENGKAVKMRKEPSKKCSLYIMLPVGTPVILEEYHDDWCKISYGWRKGWYMMSKFIAVFIDNPK